MADTSVTVQTVIDNSIARAKDSSKTQWSDAQLLIFVNKAIAYVHNLIVRLHSEIAITDGTIPMVADTQEYTLSGNLDDFWAMAHNGVYFDGTGDFLTPCTYADKVRASGDTTDIRPTSYYVTSTKIGVVDIPTATSVAAYGTLHCRYFKRYTPLSLTDSMPYKNIFNEPISSFSDHVALMKTEEPTGEFTTLYNSLEESVIEIVAKRVPF